MMRALGLLTLLALLLASTVNAATYKIKPDGTGDFPTIQDAANAAVDGDVIKLKKGTYFGEGNRDIALMGKAITIRGNRGNPAHVVINPEGTSEEPHRAFRLWDGETLDTVIEGITFTGGFSPAGATAVVGGAISFNGGSATVRKCVFVENDGLFSGGAVSMIFSSPVFTDCLFERNRQVGDEGGGGAVAVIYASPTFERCAFIDNVGTGAGGFGCGLEPYWDDPSVITLIDCLFQGNRSEYARGGVLAYATGVLFDATRCAFIGNYAQDEGGAVYLFENAGGTGRPTTLLLTDCTFADNVTGGLGGAVFTEEGGETFAAQGCTFVGNESVGGAAIWLENPAAVASIENSILAFGTTGTAVGGADDAMVTLACSDVYGNLGGDYVGLISGLDGINGNISADPLFCDLLDFDLELAEDSPCLPEETGCGLMGAHPEGCDDDGDDDDEDRLTNPSLDHPMVQLGPAHPNPFHGTTRISYTLPEAQTVTLAIYDVRGRKVATLVSGIRAAGEHSMDWAGVDDRGRAVVPGVYYTRLEAGTIARSQGLLLTP